MKTLDAYNSDQGCEYYSYVSDLDESESKEEENSTESERDVSMAILVKFSSSKKRRNLFKLRSSDTISHLKTMIKTKQGVSEKRQTVVHRGKVLQDSETLAACNVKKWSIIHAIFCPEDIINPEAGGVDVSVNIMSDKLRMTVKPWYRGHDIMAVVESATGISTEVYAISHGGKVIKDSSFVFRPEENSMINEEQLPVYLLLKFQITARGCGWEEGIMVSDSHTVLDVKKMVQDFAGVKPENMVLVHGDDNMVCLHDDEKTLLFYDIKEKSKIWVLGTCWTLIIKMPQVEDTIMLSSYKVNTIKDVKNSICEKMGIPCSSQKLFCEGKLLNHESESLETLYNQLENWNCVIYATFGNPDDQDDESDEDCFTFKRQDSENGLIEFKVEQSENSESGKSSESDGESIDESDGESTDESDGESTDEDNIFELGLKESWTIFDVKAAIESLKGIPICSQKLYDSDKILNDWITLWDCDITKWSYADSPSTVIIETLSFSSNEGGQEQEPEQFALNVNSKDTIFQVLNDRILEKVLKSIHGQPCLFFNGILLHEDKELVQCGLEPESVLCLHRLVKINVTGSNGATTEVMVTPFYKFKDVKEKIELDCGIPFGLQKLTHNGDEPDDDMTIGLYEASLGSLWNLRWKFCGKSWSFFYPSYKNCSSRTG